MSNRPIYHLGRRVRRSAQNTARNRYYWQQHFERRIDWLFNPEERETVARVRSWINAQRG